ncbi:Thiamine import ATP-binding protein ThiQ [Bacteroidales bacterium Barb6]|nr:Thiamine import ATP-binding protein ThiQ [Bacteroidales bacterium Barb6]
MAMQTVMKKGVAVVVSATVAAGVWQAVSVLVGEPEFMPSVPRLLRTLAELAASGSFYVSAGATIGRGVVGMLLSLGVALGLAGLLARFERLEGVVRPLLAVMRSVPVVSFILLALIFLHAESIPLLIGFLTMFPLLTENLAKGMRSLRKEWSAMAGLFRIGRLNRAAQIVYPQLKPFLYSGLASAAGFGWRAVIMGEVLSQCSFGIGSEMKRAQAFIAVPELLAWTVVAVLIGFLTDKGIGRLARCNVPVFYASASRSFPEGQEVWKGAEVKLSDVSYLYAVKALSCRFEAGKIYGLSAPSGSGKTTLLNLINGTLVPVAGTVEADRRRGIASLFQEPELLPHLTVQENVALPLASLYTKQEAVARALEALRCAEADDLAACRPDTLSYGQQQRVALARALAFPSPLLLMDEPFKGLDEALCRRIIARLRERQKEKGQTVLFASHQKEELELLADEVFVLPSSYFRLFQPCALSSTSPPSRPVR